MNAEDGFEASDTGAIGGDDEQSKVLEYLRNHPQLLADNPQTLAAIQIPHGLEGVTSLVELQARRLREDNRALQARLQGLVGNARDNEAVSRQLQALAVALLSARSVGDTFAEIYQSLNDAFRADCSAIRIFATPAPVSAQGYGEFVGAHGTTSAVIEQCLQSARPLLGRADAHTVELLFPSHASAALSTALLPLMAPGMRGVLAIGSTDETRFEGQSGTVFLEHLGELVSHALARFFDADRT